MNKPRKTKSAAGRRSVQRMVRQIRLTLKSISLLPNKSLGPSTNPPKANEELLETIGRDKEMEILRWMQTPKSKLLLSKCEALGVTPIQVSNPDMLLPRGARVCRRLSRWLKDVAFHIGRVKSKHSEKFYAACRLRGMAAEENRPIVQRLLTMREVPDNWLVLLDSWHLEALNLPNAKAERRALEGGEARKGDSL